MIAKPDQLVVGGIYMMKRLPPKGPLEITIKVTAIEKGPIDLIDGASVDISYQILYDGLESAGFVSDIRQLNSFEIIYIGESLEDIRSYLRANSF